MLGAPGAMHPSWGRVRGVRPCAATPRSTPAPQQPYGPRSPCTQPGPGEKNVYKPLLRSSTPSARPGCGPLSSSGPRRVRTTGHRRTRSRGSSAGSPRMPLPLSCIAPRSAQDDGPRAAASRLGKRPAAAMPLRLDIRPILALREAALPRRPMLTARPGLGWPRRGSAARGVPLRPPRAGRPTTMKARPAPDPLGRAPCTAAPPPGQRAVSAEERSSGLEGSGGGADGTAVPAAGGLPQRCPSCVCSRPGKAQARTSRA